MKIIYEITVDLPTDKNKSELNKIRNRLDELILYHITEVVYAIKFIFNIEIITNIKEKVEE